ncbi:MAG: hypothetical protein V4555_00755 [Acidobacteriota bacterium]
MPGFPQTGIHIKREYNTALPNWLMDAKWWKPVNGGRKPSADAFLIYMWCYDKVTKIEEIDGVPHGFVIGYKPIDFETIAGNLGISWSSVQRNMKHLVNVGLVKRHRSSKMQEYSYSVPNCRKKFDGEQPDGSVKHKGKTYTRKAKAEEATEVSKEELDDELA